MRSKNIEFTGALDDRLSARLDSTEGDNVGLALFAHCFTCSKNLKAAGREDKISTLDRVLLIMHAPLDKTVSIENAATLYSRAKHLKSCVSLHRADHLLTNPDFSKNAGNLIAQWSNIYIEDSNYNINSIY